MRRGLEAVGGVAVDIVRVGVMDRWARRAGLGRCERYAWSRCMQMQMRMQMGWFDDARWTIVMQVQHDRHNG